MFCQRAHEKSEASLLEGGFRNESAGVSWPLLAWPGLDRHGGDGILW